MSRYEMYSRCHVFLERTDPEKSRTTPKRLSETVDLDISPATVHYPRVCSANNLFYRQRPRPPLKVLLVEAFRILVDAAIDLSEDAWIDLVMSLLIEEEVDLSGVSRAALLEIVGGVARGATRVKTAPDIFIGRTFED